MSAQGVVALPMDAMEVEAPTVSTSARSLANLAVLRADPRLAIQEDSISCLICGGAFRQLTNTHLRSHGTTAGEYKRHFGYNRGRPLMCRVLARLYAERARRAGLAARIRRRPILEEPELRRRGGARAIALEELLTRREARRREVLRRASARTPIA
jgi:predicted transcriptional regulator